MGKRELFVETALEYQGCNEADGSHELIVTLYNSIRPLPVGYRLGSGDAWCAAYVSAVAQRCKCTDVVFPECGCDRMIALYQAAGRWQEADDYTPRPGDLVFYDWQDGGKGDNRGSAEHVGIVVDVSGLTIKVIEGNLSDAVGYRNLLVDGKYIRGYALPDFEGEGAVTEPESISGTGSATPAKSCTVTLPVLRKGMAGGTVRVLQLLLIGAGHAVGLDGADGDFGYNTEQAVKACQEKHKLDADGVAGQATWTALLTK